MEKQLGVAVLGSTGSIGCQALEVIDAHPNRLRAEVLVAHSSADRLIEQAKKYRPNVVVIGREDLYPQVSEALFPLGIKVYTGSAAIEQVVTMQSIDVVLTAMVGFAGLRPTLSAIRAGKNIALANKETLVVAGALITREAVANRVLLLPVDSEHSAIFQCLTGEDPANIEKLILTASGGPFRGMKAADLRTVTREQALKHPNWNMGAKITIDSATLMNKGLEVIEARWLFGVKAGNIDVVVHPQSIVHSLVQFTDGSIIAQLGLPDMKLPIQYALGYPDRLPNTFQRFNFANYPQLSFEQPDTETFRNLALAFESIRTGGLAPCVLNAANEVAVDQFLKGTIAFHQLPQVCEHALQQHFSGSETELETLEKTDERARKIALDFCREKSLA